MRKVEITKDDVSQHLTDEEKSSNCKVRLIITKPRGQKGTKGIRMFEGTPIDDSPAINPVSDLKLKFGDKVRYNSEECSVTKARRTWIEVEKGDGSKIWTRHGNLELLQSVVKPIETEGAKASSGN